MPRRSSPGSPEPDLPPESEKDPGTDHRINIGQNNTGIVSSGLYAKNVQVNIEGGFVYQITRLLRPGAGRYHDPWREQPSQLLLARHRVVPFTGREDDLRELQAWRDDPGGPGTALRLLYGPGGQGKTRLALEFAAKTPSDWDVWEASTLRAASSSVRAGGMAPRSPGRRALIIVDYAERWPVGALRALMQALASRPGERRRILLVARSAHNWWTSTKDDLRTMGYGLSASLLEPLEGGVTSDRRQAYLAALASFAATLGLSDLEAAEIPADLDLSDPLFGLTLTVHMAALVAVDAYVSGRQPPADPVALSAYLLDRERAHWAKLHEAGRVSIEAGVMAQVVYTATLTGRMSYADGQSALEQVAVESSGPLGSTLKDHAVAYPADNYLEPLYPDRLGEDFLALITPGHPRSDQQDPWAATAVTRLLALPDDSPAPAWTRHALTVLIETARRWDHIASGQLFPLLGRYPRLALKAGGAALVALSNLENVDFGVLETIAACLPERHTDLDAGMAALTRRLGEHLLMSEQDPAERARIYSDISRRMQNAGLHDQGLAPAEEAVRIYRELAIDRPASFQESLAWELNTLGIHLDRTGREDEALLATQESAEIIRELVGKGRTDLEPRLGRVLANLSVRSELDREQRLRIAQEAVAIGRRWAVQKPDAQYLELAGALENLAFALDEHERHDEAIAATREAVTIRRGQAEKSPEVYGPDLARALNAFAPRLARNNKLEEALTATEEAVDLYRRLAAADPAAQEPGLAYHLFDLAYWAIDADRIEKAVTALAEAVDLFRRLAAADPDSYELMLAHSLFNLGVSYARCQDGGEDALAATAEAAARFRRLAAVDPGSYEADLAHGLLVVGVRMAMLDRDRAAIVTVVEEAVGIYRRLAAADPSAFETLLTEAIDFRTSLREEREE